MKKNTKRGKTELYKLGKELLDNLLASGGALVTNQFCYSAFLFDQIERNLRDKIRESGEVTEMFSVKPSDFSSLGLTEYCIGSSLFSSFEKYQQDEYEQWKNAGFDTDELDELRNIYLYGEVWSKDDEETGMLEHYDRTFTISLIISISVDLAEAIVKIASQNNIPLHTVISIFHGLLFDNHQQIKLKLLGEGDCDESILKDCFKVAKNLHEYWEELISVVALSVTIEWLWVKACLVSKIDKPMEAVRSFLVQSSFYLCQEDSYKGMSDDEIKRYLADRFVPVEYSFDAFILWIDKYFHQKGLTIAKASGDSSALDPSACISADEFLLGLAVSERLAKKNLFILTYHLKGKKTNILRYIKPIFANIVSKEKSKYYYNNGWCDRTIKRYQQELGKKPTLDEIEAMSLSKEKRMRHVRDGYLTQNQLIEKVLRTPESAWYHEIEKQGVSIPSLSRKGFQGRFKRLEEKKKLFPDEIGSDGKTKYYRLTKENFLNIAKMLAKEGRRKK